MTPSSAAGGGGVGGAGGAAGYTKPKSNRVRRPRTCNDIPRRVQLAAEAAAVVVVVVVVEAAVEPPLPVPPALPASRRAPHSLLQPMR